MIAVLTRAIPVHVISNSGNQITTYGLIDSGSAITMIDPSIVKLLNIERAPSKLTLTTVSCAHVEEEGMKVNFKIAPVDSQNDHVVNDSTHTLISYFFTSRFTKSKNGTHT